MNIGLVGCVKTKRSTGNLARDLYMSTLFTGRRRYVEASCDRWFVLSARHGLVCNDEWLEDQANWFAAELLLPAAEVGDLLPSSADWTVLADLKVSWGVSMNALLQRAKSLGVMPEAAYVQALKTMSTRGWNRREPVQLPTVEAPVLLSRAAELLPQSGTTLHDLAAEIGLPVDLVFEIIGASSDPRPTVQF